jgi:hypothetical protein
MAGVGVLARNGVELLLSCVEKQDERSRVNYLTSDLASACY